MADEFAEKYCPRCEYCSQIYSRPIMYGCYHEPYRGKWIAEIDKCPKVDEVE